MRTQYIILDNNSRSVEAVHAAVSFAEAAKFSEYADIRVVFPPMLLAEIKRSDTLLKRHKRLHPEKHHRKNSKKHHEKHEGVKRNENLQVTMNEVMEAYADYIDIPPLSEVEQKLADVMIDHLTIQHNNNIHKFYDLIGNAGDSIINPETDLPELMKDGSFFAHAFEACERSASFREKLGKLKLTQDLADDAIAAWYKNLVQGRPDADLMLVSQDNGLINRVKTIHNHAYPEARNVLAHVEIFDQPAFAHHMLTELHAMRKERPEAADDARMTINACEDLCAKIASSKHPGGDLDNEKTVASRLK
jgi:hypothetical protein